MNKEPELDQVPYRDRPVKAVPIVLPSAADLPERYKGWFDASAPTINVGEATVTAIFFREQIWLLDEKRQVTSGLAKAKSTGLCAYTKRFLTSRIPVPVTEFVVPESNKAFLDWLRERVQVKREK